MLRCSGLLHQQKQATDAGREEHRVFRLRPVIVRFHHLPDGRRRRRAPTCVRAFALSLPALPPTAFSFPRAGVRKHVTRAGATGAR